MCQHMNSKDVVGDSKTVPSFIYYIHLTTREDHEHIYLHKRKTIDKIKEDKKGQIILIAPSPMT